jgi:hypothetical protein
MMMLIERSQHQSALNQLIKQQIIALAACILTVVTPKKQQIH